MLADGLKAGDEAVVWGVFSQAERGHFREGSGRDAREGGPQSGPAGNHPMMSTATRPSAFRNLSPISRPTRSSRRSGTQHGGVTGVMPEALKKAGKKPGDIIVGGIDLAPATIDGLKSGYISATLDQLLYMQGFFPVTQCVMSGKYKMPGLSLNTGAGVVTPKTIGDLTKLIDAGIR